MFHECYEYIPHKVINTLHTPHWARDAGLPAAACSGRSCFLLGNYCRQQFSHSMQLWHGHKLAASAVGVGVGLCQMTSAVAVARWEQCTSVGIVLLIAAMHHSCLMALHFDAFFGAGCSSCSLLLRELPVWLWHCICCRSLQWLYVESAGLHGQ